MAPSRGVMDHHYYTTHSQIIGRERRAPLHSPIINDELGGHVYRILRVLIGNRSPINSLISPVPISYGAKVENQARPQEMRANRSPDSEKTLVSAREKCRCDHVSIHATNFFPPKIINKYYRKKKHVIAFQQQLIIFFN